MPYIQRKIPWAEKPDFNDDYVINANIAKYVAAAYLINEKKGGNLIDVARGRKSTIVGATWTKDQEGGLFFPNSTDEVDIGDVNLAGDYTIIAMVRWNAVNAFGNILTKSTSFFGAPYYLYSLGRLSSGDLRFVLSDGTTDTNISAPPEFGDNDLAIIIGTNTGNGIANGASLYANGKQYGTGTSRAGGTSTENTKLGKLATSTGFSWDDNIYSAFILDGISLSYNVACRISSAPEALYNFMLRPHTRRIFVPAAVGGVTLQIQSSVQSQLSGNIDFLQQNVLTINESTQLQSSSDITLVQKNVLSILSSLQSQLSSNVDLLQQSSLTISGSVQLQSSNNVDLLQQNILNVSGAIQDQASSNIDLESGVTIAVDNSLQDHVSDNLDLLQQSVLNISTSTQDQSSDNVVLEFGVTISVDESVQDHVSGDITLSEQAVLTIVKAAQDQSSQNLDLTQSHVLTIDSSEQLQIAEIITLDVPSSAVGYLTAIITITPSLTAEIDTLPRS